MNHTPGPWTPSASRVNAKNDERICWIAPLVGHDVCGDREIANARLIAAAPDLLEVLQKLVGRAKLVPDNAFGVWHIESSIDGVIAEARAAIAKAEGRTP